MGYCCAIGCTNDTKKGFIMKRFPRDPERRKIWVAKVNRENWIPTESSRLCEAHFTPEMFEQKRADGKRMLRWNAIPTIFSCGPQKKSRKIQPKKTVENKIQKEKIKEESVDPTFDVCSNINSIQTKLTPKTENCELPKEQTDLKFDVSSTIRSSGDLSICSCSSSLRPRLNRRHCSSCDLQPAKVSSIKRKRGMKNSSGASYMCSSKKSLKMDTSELKKGPSIRTINKLSTVESSKKDIHITPIPSTANSPSSNLRFHPKRQRLSSNNSTETKTVKEKPSDTAFQKETLKKESLDSTLDMCPTVMSSKDDTPNSFSSSTSNAPSLAFSTFLNRLGLFPSNDEQRKIWIANAKNGYVDASLLCETIISSEKGESEELARDKSDPISNISSSVESSTENIPNLSSSSASSASSPTSCTPLNKQDNLPSDPKGKKLCNVKVVIKNCKSSDPSGSCEAYFIPEMFEKNRADGKRMLTWDAFTTIFSHVLQIKHGEPSTKTPVENDRYKLKNQESVLANDIPFIVVSSKEDMPASSSSIFSIPSSDLASSDASLLCPKRKSPEKEISAELKKAQSEPTSDVCFGVKISKEDASTHLNQINLSSNGPQVIDKLSATSHLCTKTNYLENKICNSQREKADSTLDLCPTSQSSKEDIPISFYICSTPSSNLSSSFNRQHLYQCDLEQKTSCDCSHLCSTERSPEKVMCSELEQVQSDTTQNVCTPIQSLKGNIPNCSSLSTSQEPTVTVQSCMSREDLISRIKLYQKAYMKVVRENYVLKKKLRNIRLSFKKLQENDFLKCLKKIFNDKQIDALCTSRSKSHWDKETIKKALRIKSSCGKKGYLELINQNFPLPSLRTLRRRAQQIRLLQGSDDPDKPLDSSVADVWESKSEDDDNSQGTFSV